MSIRGALGLLAVLALVSPLAAVALPLCAPGQHCAMAGAIGAKPACHGTAIQAVDCCPAAAAVELVEVVPLTSATAPAVVDAAQAPRLEPGEAILPAARCEPPSTPLYTLFRALLI
jgi:hypothetical protein